MKNDSSLAVDAKLGSDMELLIEFDRNENQTTLSIGNALVFSLSGNHSAGLQDYFKNKELEAVLQYVLDHSPMLISFKQSCDPVVLNRFFNSSLVSAIQNLAVESFRDSRSSLVAKLGNILSERDGRVGYDKAIQSGLLSPELKDASTKIYNYVTFNRRSYSRGNSFTWPLHPIFNLAGNGVDPWPSNRYPKSALICDIAMRLLDQDS